MDNQQDCDTFPSLEQQLAELSRRINEFYKRLNGADSTRSISDSDMIEVAYLAEASGKLNERFGKRAANRDDFAALIDIGHAINSSLKTSEVLRMVMDTIIRLTGAERSFLMLNEGDTEKYSIRIARNWEQKNLDPSEYAFSRTVIKKVIENGQPVLTTNAQDDERFGHSKSVTDFNLRSILCVPLKIKEKLIGVVYADNRFQTALFTTAERDLLAAFSDQAAIAIENSRLFADLQQSHVDMELAYDMTLLGWARALEFRDYESEGHSRRVTEMTIRLAESLGVEDQKLDDIRRGAILHDVGKIEVSDTILLKNGPLTDDEWEIMRKHPIYAYKMLLPIKFLHDALDIPLYHHEKWDGTGYPYGLKGEDIPLGARIFAVIDVWDALISDRPYREGWSLEKTAHFIVEQSGTHFDPQVVQAFYDMYIGRFLKNTE